MSTAAATDDIVAFSVNGAEVALALDADTPLLAVLRHDLDLCGTRIGCTEGHCGACTVLIDGLPTQSCQTPLWAVKGRAVRTIEGLVADPGPVDLPAIFLAEQAGQCGYCLTGIIVELSGLLGRRPPATRGEILAVLDERHLCRCGTQLRILRALDRALVEAGALRS